MKDRFCLEEIKVLGCHEGCDEICSVTLRDLEERLFKGYGFRPIALANATFPKPDDTILSQSPYEKLEHIIQEPAGEVFQSQHPEIQCLGIGTAFVIIAKSFLDPCLLPAIDRAIYFLVALDVRPLLELVLIVSSWPLFTNELVTIGTAHDTCAHASCSFDSRLDDVVPDLEPHETLQHILEGHQPIPVVLSKVDQLTLAMTIRLAILNVDLVTMKVDVLHDVEHDRILCGQDYKLQGVRYCWLHCKTNG